MSDPIRWDVSMTQDGIGRFVSYHDYAMKDEQCEVLRARIAELEAAPAKREDVPDGLVRVIRKWQTGVIGSNEAMVAITMLAASQPAKEPQQ